MLTRRATLGLVAAAPLMALARPALAAEPPIFAEGGVAIKGADPVAYFTEGRPVIGASEHALDWNGATWHFASAQNRDAFAAEPAAYAPQYGGYCAYAVSQDYTAKIEPEAWTIVDGKLYLNFSRRVRRIWSRDVPGHIAAANANWPDVLAR